MLAGSVTSLESDGVVALVMSHLVWTFPDIWSFMFVLCPFDVLIAGLPHRANREVLCVGTEQRGLAEYVYIFERVRCSISYSAGGPKTFANRNVFPLYAKVIRETEETEILRRTCNTLTAVMRDRTGNPTKSHCFSPHLTTLQSPRMKKLRPVTSFQHSSRNSPRPRLAD